MYKVLLWHYRDGFEQDFPTEASRTLYNDANADSDVTILTGTGKDSITELPTFDFTILPNHPLYDEIVKFKTWITVYKADRVIFHGRVLSDGSDFYGQRTVSCEGALGVLLDSIQDPVSTTRNETPKAHLQSIIASHNSQMSKTPYPEPYKCFTVGNVTVDEAETSKKFNKQDSYTQTRSAIDNELLGDYKGYLYARYEGGTLYLDWLKTFNRTNSQPVKMTVNLLDRSIEESADEYYTVMLPVGANKQTIDGKYLEDSTAIAKYGRIYHPESFSDKKKKADLLAEAQKEFAKRGTNLPLSVRIKAVDMFMLGSEVMDLRTGDKLTDVEDRDGNAFTNLTVAESTYDIFNPANDEYVLENQEALDKRNLSPSKNGTLSGRAGGGGADLFEDTKNLYRSYDNLTLDVQDNYRLSANAIYENSKYHKIITNVFDLLANESNVITQDDNVTTVHFKTFYVNNKYGYGDFVRKGDKTYQFLGEYTPGMGWDEAVEAGIIVETAYGESVDVKSIYGTSLHQEPGLVTSVIQDVTGIIVSKEHPTIRDFDEATEYNEGDYIRTDGKVYRCLYNHKGAFDPYHFTYVNDTEHESDIWSYSPVYQTDELGNPIVNLLTGEKEYQLIDGNLDGIPVSNPIKSITRRTQTEFYDVIGQTSTYQSVANDFNPATSYAIGQAVKYNNKFYWFTAAHQGPWDWDHVEPLREMATVNGEQLYTLTSVYGSTLFHNEDEIDQIVGEIEIVQTKDTNGKVTKRDLVIKNGSGIRSRTGNVEVGIFENGELNAGLLVDSLNNNSGSISALQFSQNRSYAVGDYVQYNGVIYQCTVAHNKAAWDSSHFAVATGKIAKLKADIVDLGDYATVGTLNAQYVNVTGRIDAIEGNFQNLTSSSGYVGSLKVTGAMSAGTMQASNITGTTISASNFAVAGDPNTVLSLQSIVLPKPGGYDTLSVLGTGSNLSIPNAVVALQIVAPTGTSTEYKLQGKYVTSSNWVDIGSFNRAASKVSGAWSGGTYTVSADPNGQDLPISASVSLDIGDTWDYDDTLDKYQKTIHIRSGTNIVATDYVDKPNSIIDTIEIDNGSATAPTADVDGGTLTANTFYKVVATSDTGNTKSLKFKTPADSGGSGGTITNMTIDNSSSSETADFSRSARLGRDAYYIVTAYTANDTKKFKFRTCSVSSSFSSTTTVPSDKTPTQLHVGNIRRLTVTVNGTNIRDDYYTCVP